MKKKITIDPITRISGFLETKVQVEKNIIVDAETSGLLFRGFEKMLKNREPLDAVYFTERICGICSTAHAVAAATALEDALKIKISVNDSYMRNLIHGFEFIQNHIRHFYNLTIPSYVKMPDINPLSSNQYEDYRLPYNLNKKISEDYIESIKYSRLAHEGLAILGGKAPHNHGIFVGGVTINIDPYKLTKVKSIISQINKFVSSVMLEDMNIISKYYADYFKMGGAYGNFMTYGIFDKYADPEISYVGPSVLINGRKYNFNSNKITENILHTWYTSDDETINLSKETGYSFIKSPTYNGYSMEVGPLARLILSGEYTGGSSCMDRNVARVLETKKILEIMQGLADRIKLIPAEQRIYQIPDKAFGAGLIDTTRGSLGHWISIEDKFIKHYNIITPTVWNMGPRNQSGALGIGEKSLVGTKIKDIKQPIEVGRIMRSFDPCVSCATHLVSDKYEPVDVQVIV
ncbi:MULTISPECIES: nickel-dependent hydrogenase large subunit [Clostridium]|uniref:Hydrogenase-1 large chain n=2 Tax=Clostridium TaxID=1485 RepID=D8GNQ1_CLOLD|nr:MULTISPECIES: nickel-dependent hydrogenase large subunit [Clostridium]ADK15914.1 hydrogenase-1 large chain [Clostridium ljungdahlii DSM 13528]AGY75088.1 nickel-dependent hydrogenase large subunit [Clostridium autoethanogenum DSM 10061]ALU35260.1 Cytochrome-c3 hydrogenase [Clostridium autoethanogenum DSM 10061]OAA87208.1 Periplasmic [NiFeSe] hydrogenase large subunit [Clostridium ljungdahlii DSM 13528]OVY49661.1 Periplasmic [NiFeSe] hydrogenase large subunit [Clostridium autoethanogenum]